MMTEAETLRQWACAVALNLETLRAVVRGETIRQEIQIEGTNAIAQNPRWRATPIYRIWAGVLRGDGAVAEILLELGDLYDKVYARLAPEILDAATRVRADINRGSLFRFAGLGYPSAVVALGSVCHEVHEQLLHCEDRGDLANCLAAIIGDADPNDLASSCEQEVVAIESIPIAVATTDSIPDGTTMRNVSEFVDGVRFRNLAQVKRFLAKNPEITTDRTTPQRLKVHAGQFLEAIQREKDNALEAEKNSSARAAAYLADAAKQSPKHHRRRAE